MKKLVTLMLCLCLCACVAFARTNISRNVADLPSAAQSMLKTHFGKTGVNHIKIDHKTLGGTDYDVILNNGTEIEFDSNGNWKEIDCGQTAVPAKLILPAIQKYVNTNYAGTKIVQIEIERNKYKIELSNGLDLEFSRNGKFLRIDD